jgi:two-component system nitrate/nitrite sensor histidine kinase NarX
MVKRFNQSLLLSIGLPMGAITALAFIGMLSSVFVADISEGQAAAINQAGSLRMQAYRIAGELAGQVLPLHGEDRQQTQELLHEFEQRFTDARLSGVLAKSDDPALHAAYSRVHQQWRADIQPLLMNYLGEAAQPGLQQAYLQAVDGFVANIDALVQVLETEAEANIRWLRLIQVISLFLTLAIVLATMYFVATSVIPHLQDLLGSAKAARRGDFSRRTRFRSEDELGELGDAFNLMAEDLSKMYADLEARVREKTSDLERSNRSLELLYKATSRLIESPLSNDVYEQLLRDIEQLTGVGRGTICLGSQGNDKAIRLASTFSAPLKDDIFRLCAKPDCRNCFGSGDSHMIHFDVQARAGRQLFSTPIRDAEQQYGVLVVDVPQNSGLDEWQQRLLEAVASHIAMALKMTQRTSQARMLALLEERGVMARELHDSLAQSLAYLKIQVTRLTAALPDEVRDSKLDQIISELRLGLNNAYRELRELLTTFRLKIDEAGLGAALEKTVAEFREHSDIDISFVNQLGNCQLGPNAEIHVIQVVREALSNVVRHSHARHAVVTASYEPRGQVVFSVDDDGVGMPQNPSQQHHYGLAIMRERTRGLDGKLVIRSSELGGTCVKLRFDVAGKEKFAETAMLQQKELAP